MANTKIKKLLTLQDLENFYSNRKKSFRFSASDEAEAIVVQVPGTITFAEDDYDATLGLLPVHLQSCHLGVNRNKSSISEESMKKCLKSIYNRPILGYIHQLSDGSYDFAGHEMSITQDGDLEYEEIAVGTIPESCNAQLIYDDDKDKTYLEVDGYVYEEYTRAADILRSKKQSKVSVELSLLEFSYEAKSHHLNIDKFYFSGITILGVTRDGNETPIEEGMYGSNIKLKDFSIENNSMFSNETEEMKEKLIEMQESINSLLSRFNINDSTESKENYGKEETEVGNEEIFEEVTEEVIEATDVVEEMSEEVTEESTEEVTVTEEMSEETTEETPDVVITESVEETVVEEVTETLETTEAFVEDSDDEDDDEDDKEDFAEVVEETTVKPEKYSITMSDGSIKEFALTLDDITYAIFDLVNAMYAEVDNTYYYVSVYESGYVIMHDAWNGKAYKQDYAREDDKFSLVGDRVEVFANWLTKEEESSLAEMRSNYSSIQTELNSYKEAELCSKREEVFNDPAYAEFIETEGFKNIKENIDTYSVDDLRTVCDLQFAKEVKAKGIFSKKEEKIEPKKPAFFAFAQQTKETSFLDGLLKK